VSRRLSGWTSFWRWSVLPDVSVDGEGAVKRAFRLPEPRPGMVIVEDDPRGAVPRLIEAVDPWFVYTRAGRLGEGRRSRIRRKRLAEGRYQLIGERK
jgi:hypothetical protein